MKLIVSLLSVAVLAGCASLEPVPVVTTVDEHEYMILGKLHKDDYDMIKAIVERHPNERLNFHVNSIGGTSGDLLLAMDAVYHHGNVHWYVVEHCDSACAVMALSTRHAHGTVRLHSFYGHEHHRVYPATEYNRIILDRLESYGYERAEINYMFRSIEELWPVTLEDGVMVK